MHNEYAPYLVTIKKCNPPASKANYDVANFIKKNTNPPVYTSCKLCQRLVCLSFTIFWWMNECLFLLSENTLLWMRKNENYYIGKVFTNSLICFFTNMVSKKSCCDWIIDLQHCWVKGHEFMLYEALNTIVGLFYNFSFLKEKGPNKLLKLKL